MSLIVATQKISGTYQNQNLELIKSQTKLDWDKYPVLIRDREIQSLQFQHLLEIMKGALKTPSEMAGITTITSPITTIIDKSYRMAGSFN